MYPDFSTEIAITTGKRKSDPKRSWADHLMEVWIAYENEWWNLDSSGIWKEGIEYRVDREGG